MPDPVRLAHRVAELAGCSRADAEQYIHGQQTFHSLERIGTKKLTLRSKMLFASQCLVLIHHELDQREP